MTPNSCGAARDLTLTFHIPEHKVRVFHNGISFSDIQQAKNLPVYRTKPKFLFLNVARFAPQKNQLLLIEAFALCNFTPDTELWFLGDGPCEKYCKDRVSELNLHNVIHFFGRTQNPFPFYWVADTFVLPSTFEGFPNVMLEALACQCPTIATYCGTGPSEIFGIVDPHCPPEEIVETSAGWLVPQPEIHLLKTALKLARESNNLTHKSKNASQIAKHYDIKTCLATLNQHLS
jgi:N-acetylgalactosamine-N,N'-diacetylbacillosaminyl-diphospho-undecaprenol 4-alpha-N-acetylgalactosaminyltransferase